ncbi:DNA-binding protein [Streptomyces sp. NPDC088394]|uniref:DNA-binding protein n=1 Tax=Streptomyces sp. NPDC088394 TaxID=3365860 RepID=UPI00382FB69D
MAARIEVSRQAGVPVLVSAMTIVEAVHWKTDLARLKWVLSRLRVEPVSQEDSLTAVELLQGAGGLHAHKYAIGALVAALALRVPAPVIVLTSDRDD